MKLIKFPTRYLPKVLTKKDKKSQFNMLLKSKKLYKKNNRCRIIEHVIVAYYIFIRE